jgi:hypothetical protein
VNMIAQRSAFSQSLSIFETIAWWFIINSCADFSLPSRPNRVQLRNYSIHNWASFSLGRFPDCKWFTSIVGPLYSTPFETSPRCRDVRSNFMGRSRDSTQICRCRIPGEVSARLTVSRDGSCVRIDVQSEW